MIKSCDCPHIYQDKVYGPGKRVHNACYTKNRVTGHRCTVCGNKKEKRDGQPVGVPDAEPGL
jgi:hypothetical protein